MQIQFMLFSLQIFGIQITFQYENDLLEELAFKSYEYDEGCLANNTTNATQPTVVGSIQEKLLRLEIDYAKRFKIQEICYKKKLNDLQKNIMELNRQIDGSVSEIVSFLEIFENKCFSHYFDVE